MPATSLVFEPVPESFKGGKTFYKSRRQIIREIGDNDNIGMVFHAIIFQVDVVLIQAVTWHPRDNCLNFLIGDSDKLLFKLFHKGVFQWHAPSECKGIADAQDSQRATFLLKTVLNVPQSFRVGSDVFVKDAPALKVRR